MPRCFALRRREEFCPLLQRGLQASLGTPRPHTSASATQPARHGRRKPDPTRLVRGVTNQCYGASRSPSPLAGEGIRVRCRGTVSLEGGSMDPATSALLTDLYQLNMMEADIDLGETKTAVFEFF